MMMPRSGLHIHNEPKHDTWTYRSSTVVLAALSFDVTSLVCCNVCYLVQAVQILTTFASGVSAYIACEIILQQSMVPLYMQGIITKVGMRKTTRTLDL